MNKLKSFKPECSKCGFIFYQASAIAFGALIINKQGQILLAKRGVAPHKGKYDLPGGFLEYGEGGHQALRRELKEELGIKVKKYELLDTEVGDYFFQGMKFKVLNLFYLVTDYTGKIRAQDDVASVHWFDKNKLPKNNWAFDWQPKIIIKWRKS